MPEGAIRSRASEPLERQVELLKTTAFVATALVPFAAKVSVVPRCSVRFGTAEREQAEPSFQAGAEILREGLLRPTALPKGTRAAASVVYGAATPGDISDYTVQTATAQLLKRPKGRNDIIMLCALATTEAHYKASWSSLTDEAHVCRRRGILRNSDRWGAHAGHLHVQGLIMVGHNR